MDALHAALNLKMQGASVVFGGLITKGGGVMSHDPWFSFLSTAKKLNSAMAMFSDAWRLASSPSLHSLYILLALFSAS